MESQAAFNPDLYRQYSQLHPSMQLNIPQRYSVKAEKVLKCKFL